MCALQISRYLHSSPNKEASFLDVQYLRKMSAVRSAGILLSFFCIIVSTSGSSDVFDAVLGNTASCHKTCQMTYSLHTYPRVSASFTDDPKHSTSFVFFKTMRTYYRCVVILSLVSNYVFVRDYISQRMKKVNRKWKHGIVCLFWPFCFGRKRLCTPVKEVVVSSPFVSLWVTVRISTKPNQNANRVTLILTLLV